MRLPALDIHTIGAGGGSIARIDSGGASSSARRARAPNRGRPATDGGGTEPTVTDADLVAGRIPEDTELPGIGRPDRRHGPLERAGATPRA
ncbi:MAG: hydantoinase/oxoprolinase family protein [Acidimicrobiales bacterium]